MHASDLLERSEQRSAIAESLRATRQGDGRVLLIEGPAGIGKSRLLQELRLEAGSSARVLTARASELERSFAFGVVRQLLEAAVRDPELGPIATEGAGGAARAIFEETPGESAAASFALLHGLHWLTLNLAELGPLVLTVDDLHWCDPCSLRFLAYLARRLEGTSILLAAATRPVAASAAGADLIADLLAEPGAVHVYPTTLSEGGVAELLGDQLGQEVDAAFARACFDATDGNPLLLRQLARSIQAEGTPPVAEHVETVRRTAYRALSRSVMARVGRCSTDAVAVARALAVLGDTSTAGLVGELAEVPAVGVNRAWAELVEAEVLARERLEFVHALVRDAIYFDLPEPQRQLLHARAARFLDAAGAPVERTASQLALAPRTGDCWATEIAFAAGEAALLRGAPESAAAHFQRALAEPAEPDRQGAIKARLAEALFDVDVATAIEVLREIVASQDDPDRARTELGMAQGLALTDQWTAASELTRAAHDRLDPEHVDLRAALSTVRAVAALFGADDPEALKQIARHRSVAADAGPGERMRAGYGALAWAYSGGSADECAHLALQALTQDPAVMREHMLISIAPYFVLALADHEDGLSLWERARAEAHRTGSIAMHLTIGLWLGVARQRRGDLAEAVDDLGTSLALGERWGSGQEPMLYNRASLALTHVERGDIGSARAVLDGAPPPANRRSLGSLLWWHAHAWVLFSEGRIDEALAATYALEHRADWVDTPVGFDWRLPRALCQHRLGDTSVAIQTAEDAVRVARPWGSPGTLGPALRILGEVSGEAGIEHFQAALTLLDGSTARIQLTRTLLSLGATLRRGRKPTDARPYLERAYQLAGACGSPGLVEHARTELAASGVRRRSDDIAGPGALTPSERRVAGLAAGGRSNREIAQELFVTPKTVEVHLSATYRKLGIASRHGLSTALQAA